MQTLEPHVPSYHNMSGLSYTELWNALHSVHHSTFQSSNYNLSGSFQSDQPRDFPPSSAVNSVDTEFSGGSQWSGDSNVNGSITVGKKETSSVPGGNNHHEMVAFATAAKTTTKTLTGLQTFQPVMSSQNRLVMQTPQAIDRDWYSLEPRWMEPKLLQGGERFKVADSDAADALLSMKRAAVVHFNPAVVNSNPSMQLRTRESHQTMKGLLYDELTPFIEEKFGADPSTRKTSSVIRSAIGSDSGREMLEAKDLAHTRYWRHQDISRMYNSSSNSCDMSAKTSKDSSSSDTDDFRSSGYHSSNGYQTTGLLNVTPMSPYNNNKAGGHGTSESDYAQSNRYFTRSSMGTHSSDFMSSRGNVNLQSSPDTQPYIGTTPIHRPLDEKSSSPTTTGRNMEDALVNNQPKQNQKTHPTINQSHQCHICGKACTRPSSLRTHIRCHYGDKPYLCQLCGKNFSQAANLTAHMRIHSGEKPFKCTVCSRSFSQSSSVKTHMRTHTGERPYSCNFCSKAFSDSSTLINHRRTHTGEKPYQCLVCYRPFSQSGNLYRHMRIHHRRNGQASKAPTPAAAAIMA